MGSLVFYVLFQNGCCIALVVLHVLSLLVKIERSLLRRRREPDAKIDSKRCQCLVKRLGLFLSTSCNGLYVYFICMYVSFHIDMSVCVILRVVPLHMCVCVILRVLYPPSSRRHISSPRVANLIDRRCKRYLTTFKGRSIQNIRKENLSRELFDPSLVLNVSSYSCWHWQWSVGFMSSYINLIHTLLPISYEIPRMRVLKSNLKFYSIPSSACFFVFSSALSTARVRYSTKLDIR